MVDSPVSHHKGSDQDKPGQDKATNEQKSKMEQAYREMQRKMRIAKLSDDIKVHSGFYKQLTENNVYDNIVSEVKKLLETHPDFSIYITGHSLGGAIAQIIGMWLHKKSHNVQVFSYGSPKVSNEVMSGGQPTHWRVVRLSDPIPFTPMWPYAHTGLFIDSQTLDWGPDNDNGLISETDGLTHSILKYVTTLKEQL